MRVSRIGIGLLIGCAWLASLGSVYWVLRSAVSGDPAKPNLKKEIREWEEIVAVGRSLKQHGPSGCGDVRCGYHRLFAIWVGLDETVAGWEKREGEPSLVDKLNDVGRKRYSRLLPVFKGALAGSGLDIGAYLELRDSVASEFAQVSSNEIVRRFVLGASSHSGFVVDSGQPAPRSLTNEQCRAQVLAYLESGRHASLEEEIWLGVFALAFRSME